MNFDSGKVIELDLNDILPNRFQPRIHFNEDAINELSESIKEHGVIQPIVVRKINDKYEIIAGERRYKASVMAGKRTIPAIITDLNDKDSAEIALIENVQREDLTAIEEAISYKKILNMGYLTQDDLSSKLGKKQSTISNKLRLLNLDEQVQDALLEKKISERHARSLLKLDNIDQQKMLDRIIKERLTVRKTDAEIEKILSSKMNNDQIEILDVPDYVDDKGDIKMNNEMNNNFNIPSVPIIDDVPTPTMFSQQPRVEEQPAPQQPNMYNIPEPVNTENQFVMAPGFMDVDKIQNIATDINVEKPTADLSTLLTPTPAPEEVKPVVVDTSIFGFTPAEPIKTETDTAPAPTPGKFFDLNNLGEIEDATTPESIENLLNAAAEKAVEPEVQPVNPVVEPTENKSPMFGINLEPKNPDYVANVDAKEANIDFGEPKSVINTNDFDFGQFYNNTDTSISTNNIPPVEEQPIVSTPVVENVMPEIKEVEVPTPTFNQMATPNVAPVVAESVAPTIPYMEPSVTAPTQPQMNTQSNYTIPSVDELDDFLANIDSTTPLTTPMAESMVNPTITAAPSYSSPKIDITKVNAIMKEAKEKIEALGIKVDIDEFDFDDMYQAIIKIDK